MVFPQSSSKASVARRAPLRGVQARSTKRQKASEAPAPTPSAEAARFFALQAEAALARAHYIDAAGHFGAAAAALPPGHDGEHWGYLTAEADCLYRQGTEAGSRAHLEEAARRYRQLSEMRPRAAFPLAWALTQMHLGIVLQTLGEREDADALQEAAAAYGRALEEF